MAICNVLIRDEASPRRFGGCARPSVQTPLYMPTFPSDFRHAARTLLRGRAFTAVCVVSLGLGMGVVIAILLLMRMVFATPPGVEPEGAWPNSSFVRAGQLRAQAGAGDHRHLVLSRLPRRPRRRRAAWS